MTLKDVSDIVWLNWKGKIDKEALAERLQELVATEKAYNEQNAAIDLIKRRLGL